MITFRTTADISPDRQVTVNLPPETPTGKAELVVTINPQEPVPSKPGALRHRFGAIHSGDPRSADNEQIDVDLERVYGDSNG